MPTSLVTAIGSASADTVARTLRTAGHSVHGFDIYPKHWHGNFADYEYVAMSPLAANQAEYRKFLIDYCLDNAIDYVIPLTDVEVDIISPLKPVLSQNRIMACVPDVPVTRLCRDKASLSQVVSAIGVCDTIETRLSGTIAAEEIPFPRILKPRHGRSSLGNLIARSQGDYDYGIGLRNDYVVQPYVDGSVFTVDIVRDTHGNVACVTREELLRTGNGLGLTVHVLPNHPLDSTCSKLAEHLDIVGAVNAEFIRADSGEYYFLEINPRFSGGVAFSHLGGYDVVTNALIAYGGSPIETPHGVSDCIIARRYREIVTHESP